MSSRKPQVGDVIQLTLPGGRYAYGRVLRDAGVAFYSETTAEPAYHRLAVVAISSSWASMMTRSPRKVFP
jgi:hypothetical protein